MKNIKAIQHFIVLIISLFTLTNTVNAVEITWEQQQKLQEYFDTNNKIWGFSDQVLQAVLSENTPYPGNYADALLAVDLANKFANAQDKQLLEAIIIEASKKGIEKFMPNLSSVLGWASWAKTGMELLDQFVINPARMGSSLDDYFNKRDAAWDPGESIATVRDWGNVLVNLKKEFRKQYGDAAFKEITPSSLTLLPRWDDKFNAFVAAYFEAEYIKYKVKKEAAEILKSKKREVEKGAARFYKMLKEKQKELDKEHDCDKNEHWDEDKKSCECNDGYTEDKDDDCIKVRNCDENEYWDIAEGDCECNQGYSENKQGNCIEIKDCDKYEVWNADEGECECKDGYKEDEKGICVEDKKIEVKISLTYPAGKSPRVFTKGWIFGAHATSKVGDEAEKDISNQVQWSGTGSFAPATGSISRPTFSAGRNTIKLSVTIGDQIFTEKFKVRAINPKGYARVSDKAFNPVDSHGCIACPHSVVGPIITGSPNILIDGLPAARKGDSGVHAACCGSNSFEIVQGDPNVLINGRPAARLGDKTQHCGGVGKIVEASFTITECEENAYWDSNKDECICKDSYDENEDGGCVKIDEDHDCKDNEEWNDDKKDCVCKDGFTPNKKGECIEIKDCDNNQHFDVDKDDCVCDDGFTPNKKGDCIEIKDCSGDNEHFDADIGDCECDDGFTKNDKNKCVAEVVDDICSMGHINSLISRMRMLIAENKSDESLLLSYIRKFEKEINDQSSDPCANSIVAYSYYNALSIAARMDARVSDILDMSVEIVWLQAICPDLDAEMASKGITIKSLVSSISGVGSYKNKIPELTSRLHENGCDEKEVEEEGEKIVPPEKDPGFIQGGGTSTEMPGDGDDNDGDGQQDEEVQGLAGYNVTMVLYDSGSAADDVFGLSVGGYGSLGQTPAGGLRSYGLNLPPGSYIATVSVIVAPDDVGTYTLSVLYKGESIGSITGSPPQGSSATLSFTVPSE